MSAHNEYESSDDEKEEEVTKLSDVYLGFVDSQISKDDQPSIEDSFIGDLPVWFSPESPPPPELLLCKVCNSPMALLSQIFAPFNDALYDRVIYVFTCQAPSCRRQKGSIRAIRAIQKDPVKMQMVEKEKESLLQKDLETKLNLEQSKKLEIEATKDIFSSGTSANPFGASSNPFDATANPFANPFSTPQGTKNEPEKPTFASVALKAAPKKEVKAASTEKVKLKKFPGSFIYVEQEKFDERNKKDDFKMSSKIEDLDQSVLDTDFESLEGSSSSIKSPENPEALKIASMMDDPVFGNFSDTISYNAQQILRYDLGGEPLLYSSKDDVYKLFHNDSKQLKVPNPGYNPSSTRQFEFQLMPKVIMDLEKDNVDLLNGMEWGTIIVATDVEDFIPHYDSNHVGYVEEWCGVQWEEEVKR